MLYEKLFKIKPLALAGLVNQAFLDCQTDDSPSTADTSNTQETPVLIFVHGFLDNAASFSTLIPLLDNYPCVALDLAGHGKSEHRGSDAHYHLVDYAYDLHRFIASLGQRKFVLIGHSLGAIVSSIYASTQPSGLLGFVAIESVGPLSESAETTAEQIKASFQSRDLAYNAIKHPSSFAALVRARCAMSDLSAEQASIILTRNISRSIDDTSLVERIQWITDKRLRTKSCMRMTEEQSINILKNIKCKRSLILGNKGFDKIKRIVSERVEHFKEIQVDECEGGHHVHLSSPKAVAQTIKQHLDSF